MIKIKEVKKFIKKQSQESKIYIGCDSVSYKRNNQWWADYYRVVVIHIDGCKGCKIFGEKITERDWKTDKKKPRFRLMTETYKAVELFLAISKEIGDRSVEIHLDLNPDKRYASSVVVAEAIGYVKGTCNIVPKLKPDAFVATHAADRMLRKNPLHAVPLRLSISRLSR